MRNLFSLRIDSKTWIVFGESFIESKYKIELEELIYLLDFVKYKAITLIMNCYNLKMIIECYKLKMKLRYTVVGDFISK